jgi:hypothetical protein
VNVQENLMKGRRNLDGFPQLIILNDWTWEDKLRMWSLRFSICLELSNLQNTTYWVALVSNAYPNGEVSIYPDYKLGIRETFPHQSNNDLSYFSPLCKSGKICLDRPSDKFFYEKLNEYEKLAWYVNRLIQWIQNADNNTLLKEGEYFEAPATFISSKLRFIYDEDYFSIEVRNDNEARFGFVDIAEYQETFFVKRFNDCSGNLVFEIAWGKRIKEIISSSENQVGSWILLEEPAVINRWQAPNTYDQLKEALRNQKVSFRDIFSKISRRLRDNKQHLLLIGYPAPLIVGHEPDSIIWQAIQLPILSTGNSVPPGFRKNETGWLQSDLTFRLSGNTRIEWINSENWNSNNILTRGRVNQNLCRMRVLVIGAGSLGSIIAQMLVRSGVTSLTIIDDDIFEIGNMARHILDVESIGLNKAEEVAKKLNKLNPHSNVHSINKKFDTSFIEKKLNYDAIFDCSGENDVLEILSQINTSQWLCSASFSFEVNNIYVYIGSLKNLKMDEYSKQFSRVINNEIINYDFNKMPWEGIGCWSPVFPATFGDVSLAASIVVSAFDQRVMKNITRGEYLVFQKQFDSNGIFSGVIQVDTTL